MKTKAPRRASIAILLSGVLFVIWYSVAANYDYGALAGTYVSHSNGATCILQLKPDRTFVEEVNRPGGTQRSEGHWRRYGEAHVAFSKEFLTLPGEETNAEGEADGEFDKRLGIFPTLVLAPVPNGPVLHKKFLR